MTLDALHLLAQANLAGSLAIAAVALLRRPIRSAFGPRAAYGLWLVPLTAAVAALAPLPQGTAVARVVLEGAGRLPAVASLAGGWPGPDAIGGAWALGALICAGILGVRQARFLAAVQQGVRLSRGGSLVIRARRSDIGPAVVGRAIILPSDFEGRFTTDEQAAVLAHEAQHLARGDVLANALAALVQCLCWFNPLVHVAAQWVRYDQELACDATVIAQHPRLRRPYAEALLKAQALAPIPPAGCAWRARGFPALRDRIRLLKRGTPSAPRRACAALLIGALTLGGGYGAWATQPLNTPTLLDPEWATLPNGSDLVRFYPREALRLRRAGMALLQCRVEASGALSTCRILREAPQASGFGTAALQMASLFRMKPRRVNGSPVAGGVVRIPVRFQAPPGADPGRP